jgi:hypothetical protein
MAVVVLTNVSVVINSVTLSDHATSVTITYEKDSVETTAFGDAGHKFTGGLQNNSVEIAFQQDFAASNVEATVYPLVGTTTTVELIPVATTISGTNPKYTVSNAFLASHTPVAGGVGELATTTLSFTGGSLVKTTSP